VRAGWSGSFFLGQADELPEPLRVFPLLAVPAFLPLLVMLYWLWRVRVRQAFRGIIGAGAPGALVNDAPRQVAGVG
jgi:hypothetical protein